MKDDVEIRWDCKLKNPKKLKKKLKKRIQETIEKESGNLKKAVKRLNKGK